MLNVPDAKDVHLGDLPLQQPPFTVHVDHLRMDDQVHVFHGMIGGDGDLVRTGDYVKLSSTLYQVCVCVQYVSLQLY